MAGLTGAYQLNHFVKGIIARPRPFMVLPDVNKLVEVSGFSCPSTHSTMAFMAAIPGRPALAAPSLKRRADRMAAMTSKGLLGRTVRPLIWVSDGMVMVSVRSHSLNA